MDDDDDVIGSEDVLFRVWFYPSSNMTKGVIDLMRKRKSIYTDALEAKISEDKYKMLRLNPREEGRDIPKKWYAIIETELLALVSIKAVNPYRHYIFGQAKLRRIVDLKHKFSELELQEVRIISPKEFQDRGGGLINDNWPDSYKIPPKVFLCHSSKDKPFVRRLAQELQNYEIEVWFDENDISVGQSFMESIQDGIQKANFVAVVLTPNFLQAVWAKQELQIALNHEINTRQVKVLPLLKESCDIPPFLAAKSYADFRDRKFKSGLNNLIRSIHKLQKAAGT